MNFNSTTTNIMIFVVILVLMVGISNSKKSSEQTEQSPDSENFVNYWHGPRWRRGPWRRRSRMRRRWRRSPWRRHLNPWYYRGYSYNSNPPRNPGCDGQACGGYCTPWNSLCCGGTSPSTCNRLECQQNKLCNK